MRAKTPMCCRMCGKVSSTVIITKCQGKRYARNLCVANINAKTIFSTTEYALSVGFIIRLTKYTGLIRRVFGSFCKRIAPIDPNPTLGFTKNDWSHIGGRGVGRELRTRLISWNDSSLSSSQTSADALVRRCRGMQAEKAGGWTSQNTLLFE